MTMLPIVICTHHGKSWKLPKKTEKHYGGFSTFGDWWGQTSYYVGNHCLRAHILQLTSYQPQWRSYTLSTCTLKILENRCSDCIMPRERDKRAEPLFLDYQSQRPTVPENCSSHSCRRRKRIYCENMRKELTLSFAMINAEARGPSRCMHNRRGKIALCILRLWRGIDAPWRTDANITIPFN